MTPLHRTDILRALWQRYNWIFLPLGIFGVSRLVSTWFLLLGADKQIAMAETTPAYTVKYPSPESPGYLNVATNWDGQWYRSIAENGYPATLPLRDGIVAQNEWAFYPVYPFLARALMGITEWGFPAAAVVVSLVASAVAVLVLFRSLEDSGGRFVAIAGVSAVSTFPTSPTFQVAYSEGVALLLIALSLSYLAKRRYAWVAACMLTLSLTRPIVLPFAVVIGVHWLVRWRNGRAEPFPPRERIGVAFLALLTAGSMGTWPTISGVVTGNWDAYAQTQAAWIPGGHGLWGTWLFHAVTSGTYAVFVFGFLSLLMLVVLRLGRHAWTPELRSWAIAYPLYLLMATRPTSSLLRYLMLAIAPLWPFPDLAAAPETRRLRWPLLAFVVAAGLVGQYYWVTRVFTIPVAAENQLFP